MRELPEEENGRLAPRLPGVIAPRQPRSRSWAASRREWRRRGGPPRPLLQRRVQEKIACQRESADQPASRFTPSHKLNEIQPPKGQCRKPKRAVLRPDGPQAAGDWQCAAFCDPPRARTTDSAPPCRRRSAPFPRWYAGAKASEMLERNLRQPEVACKPKEIADPRAHEDEPGDARFG